MRVGGSDSFRLSGRFNGIAVPLCHISEGKIVAPLKEGNMMVDLDEIRIILDVEDLTSLPCTKC